MSIKQTFRQAKTYVASRTFMQTDPMLVKADDDGLAARFLTVFLSPVPLLRPTEALDEEFAINAFKRLHGLQPAVDDHGALRPIFIHFDEDARQALQDFRGQCRDWEMEASGLMKSHIGKLPGLAVRVSLILAYLDWAAGPNEEPVASIAASHIGRACHYVGERLLGHAFRAYGAAAAPSEVRAARLIARIIQSENLTQISTRDIQRRRLRGIQKATETGPAFSLLEEAGWLALRPSEGPGRPAKLYDVNSMIWNAK